MIYSGDCGECCFWTHSCLLHTKASGQHDDHCDYHDHDDYDDDDNVHVHADQYEDSDEDEHFFRRMKK